MSDNEDAANAANMRVMLALGGLEFDLEDALANLLRSNHLVDPIVRSGIADALENKHISGIRLKAQGMGKGVSPRQTYLKRVERLRIGREFHEKLLAGADYESTLLDLMSKYGIERAKAGFDLKFYRDSMKALAQSETENQALEVWWKARFGAPATIANLQELGIKPDQSVGNFMLSFAREHGFSHGE
ncbi:hypothetical protein [uncultured Sphingomonas sp.]|uniref:hypothetical protein n=1 Tax=uncultured Sphingomonas sp. TaxID=158754 RepID=UPI0025DC639E|nr:hypothetical protein [uncultured Sphingomonas sp.]